MKKIKALKYLFFVVAVSLILSLASCSLMEEPVGILKTEINESGELVITYTDGTEANLGKVVGKDGEDGKDGENGKNGLDGLDGIDGKDGKDGEDGENGKSSQELAIQTASAKALMSGVSIYCDFVCQNIFGQRYSEPSAGSGVIYKLDKEAGDALIITNYHVLYHPDSINDNKISEAISVYLYGSEYENYKIEAEYVGGSLQYDIAVLRISGSEVLKNSDALSLNFADSDEINVGESAIAVGNPEAMGFSATLGIVSADSEYIKTLGADDKTVVELRVMRIDTGVNAGNSGGGLYNSRGEFIGIVSVKSVYDSIAYAIPSNLVRALADNIIYYCLDTDVYNPVRPMFGITVQIDSSHAEYDEETSRAKIVEEIVVVSVDEDCAASGILEAGDVIKSAKYGNSELEITRQHHLDFMFDVKEGDVVSLTIERNGEIKTVDIAIDADDLVAN